ASYHAQAHKGFCYDEYELVIGSGCNKQWLQLLPIETWELSRRSSWYGLLPPVYDYVFQLRRFVEEFSEQTFDEICQHLHSIQT
ncbi:hypothetical protein Tco_0342948, partial [Tanacetum coccineum]